MEVEFGLQWASADPAAGYQISRAAGGGEPVASDTKYFFDSSETQVDITELLELTIDVDDSDTYDSWYIRHARNKQYSAWVGDADL